VSAAVSIQVTITINLPVDSAIGLLDPEEGEEGGGLRVDVEVGPPHALLSPDRTIHWILSRKFVQVTFFSFFLYNTALSAVPQISLCPSDAGIQPRTVATSA